MYHRPVTSRSIRLAWRGGLALLALAALAAPPRAAHADEPAAAPKLAGIWKLNEKESDSFEKKMQERMGSREGGDGGRGEGGGWRGGGGGMGGGGRRGWGGGGGGRRGPGGPEGGGAEGDGPRRNPEMAELAHPAATLLIEQTDSTFILSDQGQTIQTLALVPKVTLPGMAVPQAPGDSARTASAPAMGVPTDARASAGGPPPTGAADALQAAPPAGSAPTRGAGGTPAAGQRPPDGSRYQAWWDRSRLMAARVTARGGRMNEIFELGQDGKSLVIRTSVELRPDTPPIELKRVYDRYEGE